MANGGRAPSAAAPSAQNPPPSNSAQALANWKAKPVEASSPACSKFRAPRARNSSTSRAPRGGRRGLGPAPLHPPSPSHPQRHVLRLQILGDPLAPALAAEARLLDPAEGGGGV